MTVPTRDRDLVAKTLAGDEQAFGELVARYREAVLGVAFHRTGRFEEARDIAQEAFLKAYANLPKLRKPESFASWLYHIADLTALEAVRRPRREVPLPPEEALPAAGADPVSELADRIRAALAALDEPTRLAVVLHYIDGYSHAEVASFLGTTAGAVRTRVSRAKRRIQEEVMSETEWALKEAVKRVMAAVSAGEWQTALDEVRRSGLPPEQHPDLAYGAGLAQTVVGWEPFSPQTLSEGADLLLKALESGHGDPTTVWRAVTALSALGEYARIPPALTRYMERTSDPNERVKAGARLAGAWEMLGDHEAAARAHRASLTGLGEQADYAAKLDSYLENATALAYANHGAGLEWLQTTLRLWHSAPQEVQTLERAARLLQSAVSAVRQSEEQAAGLRELTLQYMEELLRDPRLEDRHDRLVALRAKGGVAIDMFRLYSKLGLPEKAREALETAKGVAEELRRGAGEAKTDGDAWREAAFVILANAGILSRYSGSKQEAVALLREAEQLAAPPSSIPPVLLQLAAAVLETGGEKQEALRYLRRVAEETSWGYSGFPQQEFRRDPAFEAVRNDPEFVAVIERMRK